MKQRYNDNNCESPLSVPLYKLEARLTFKIYRLRCIFLQKESLCYYGLVLIPSTEIQTAIKIVHQLLGRADLKVFQCP